MRAWLPGSVTRREGGREGGSASQSVQHTTLALALGVEAGVAGAGLGTTILSRHCPGA